MDFLSSLQNYVPFDAIDAESKQFIIDFYNKHDGNIFTRDNSEGHMCACCWVVNPNRDKVLMAHHNLFNSFAWMGGHADGDTDLARVARKELEEESGLVHYRQFPDIFLTCILGSEAHVKNGRIVENHQHPVFVYLFEADEQERVRPQEGENTSVKWLSAENIAEFMSMKEQEIVLSIYKRVMDKVRHL